MKTISVLSKKGGVGKTLTSIGVAQVLGEAGHTVALLDRDPEGTATSWAYNAQEAGTALPYRVVGPMQATTIGAVDFLVVDTPPNDKRTLQDTAKQSEVLLVPLLPGSGEVDRLEETVTALSEVTLPDGVQLGFVLNRLENDGVSRAMPDALAQLGYPVVAHVRKSVDYQRSFGGLIPGHLLAPFREALNELGVQA
ncbi:ParA family protein [Deinococcus sp. HMF7604]|uniref:ParA family protein n=1 Tax=Deinococcus betulae TaxID=2873312 RepID=UPI001CCF3C1D|nr:ParA family protein [Deinococcus betulae]MBZ9752982.1 ParA family protein [Deinococcus betulae]